MSELKPCPFDGTDDALAVRGDYMAGYGVYCRCGTEGPLRISEAEAIAAWNRRAPQGEPTPESQGGLSGTHYDYSTAVQAAWDASVEQVHRELAGAGVGEDWEIRRNDDGTVDEIVGTGSFHMEQLDTDLWWCGLTDWDGVMLAWTMGRDKKNVVVTLQDVPARLSGDDQGGDV